MPTSPKPSPKQQPLPQSYSIDSLFGEIVIELRRLDLVWIRRDEEFTYKDKTLSSFTSAAGLCEDGTWGVGSINVYIKDPTKPKWAYKAISPALRKEMKGILRDTIEQWWFTQGADIARIYRNKRCASLKKQILNTQKKLEKEEEFFKAL